MNPDQIAALRLALAAYDATEEPRYDLDNRTDGEAPALPPRRPRFRNLGENRTDEADLLADAVDVFLAGLDVPAVVEA